MNEKELILEAMNKAGVPLNAGKIAELTVLCHLRVSCSAGLGL